MKERPLIVTTELVPKILDGTKTQTRRVIKPQPTRHRVHIDHSQRRFSWTPDNMIELKDGTLAEIQAPAGLRLCPYGQVGDRFWVKETYIIEEGEIKEPTDRPFKNDFEYGLLIPHYKATEPDIELVDSLQDDLKTKWRPPLFMPRWVSRITLEITGIRVERLQEISNNDVVAEGVSPFPHGYTNRYLTYRKLTVGQVNFMELWDSLNAKRTYPWESNPWVWVIAFKRIPQNG